MADEKRANPLPLPVRPDGLHVVSADGAIIAMTKDRSMSVVIAEALNSFLKPADFRDGNSNAHVDGLREDRARRRGDDAAGELQPID